MAPRKKAGALAPMTTGEAVRAAAMDCEAGRPLAAVLVWCDSLGRVHKRVFPEGDALRERGLLSVLDEMPFGSTREPRPTRN